MAARTIHVEANVAWRVARDRQSKQYIAICDDLNITLFAETYRELSDVVAETLGLLIRDLIVNEELDEFLKEHGWQLEDSLPERLPRGVSFDVPFRLDPERGCCDSKTVLA